MRLARFADARLLIVGGLLLVGGNAWAQEGMGENWAVVQIGDDLRVVPSAEVPDLRKSAQEDHRNALKDHEAAKREAKKAGEKFADPKPKALVFKVLGDSIATEEEANRVLEKHQARLEKLAGKGKQAGFAVVRIDKKYQVVAAAELGGIKKKLTDEHKEALRRHQEAKREAKKNKSKFDRPTPKKPSLKIVKSSFKTEEKAEEFLEKLKEKERKKSEKKTKKDTKPKKKAKGDEDDG